MDNFSIISQTPNLSATFNMSSANTTRQAPSNDDVVNSYLGDVSSVAPRSPSEQLLENISKQLIIYYCPFLVIFGTIGNVLSMMVFSRKSLRTSTMSVYTRFMAFNDLAALYTGPVYYYMDVAWNININLFHDVICRTYKYRVFLFTDVSAYAILSLTSERLFSVILPHKVRIFCAKQTAYYVTVVTFLLIALSNAPLIFWSHILEKYDQATGTNVTSCEFLPEPEFENMWFFFDLTKFCVIPVCFITISNILLLVQLYGSRRCNVMCCRTAGNDQDSEVAEMSRKANNRKQKSVTLMLICVSVVFLVCNLPVVIFPVNLIVLPTPAAQELATIISDLLMFTNNTVNFLLYCACGTRFRHELIAMLCFRRNGGPGKPATASMSDR